MAKIDELTELAREYMTNYTDAEILTSQKHTTSDEAEILERLSRIRGYLGGTPMALSAVVNVLRERRAALK